MKASLILRTAFAAIALSCCPVRSWAALPCQGPAGDCVIATSATVATGVYDIRPRNLVVQNKNVTVSGAGLFEILANNITLQPGGRFTTNEPNGNVTVDLEASGAIQLQRQGTSKSRITASGNYGGGNIILHAGTFVTLAGALFANASNLLGFGGTITVLADNGDATLGGDPSEGEQANGSSQGSGGLIDVEAPAGSISISTQLLAKSGDCSGCEIDLIAGQNITATTPGVINLSGSGAGVAGALNVQAGGSISLSGNVFANGASDPESGSGGDVAISAGGAVTVGRIELTGGTPDGDGGTLAIDAGATLTENGPVLAHASGSGDGADLEFSASGDITIAGQLDATADTFGGLVFIASGGLALIAAPVRSIAPIDAQHPDAKAGSVAIMGCQLRVTASVSVVATGPGTSPLGTIHLAGANQLTVLSPLTASVANILIWGTMAPYIVPPDVPAPTLIQDPNFSC
jgi:hypothetical protein